MTLLRSPLVTEVPRHPAHEDSMIETLSPGIRLRSDSTEPMARAAFWWQCPWTKTSAHCDSIRLRLAFSATSSDSMNSSNRKALSASSFASSPAAIPGTHHGGSGGMMAPAQPQALPADPRHDGRHKTCGLFLGLINQPRGKKRTTATRRTIIWFRFDDLESHRL